MKIPFKVRLLWNTSVFQWKTSRFVQFSMKIRPRVHPQNHSKKLFSAKKSGIIALKPWKTDSTCDFTPKKSSCTVFCLFSLPTCKISCKKSIISLPNFSKIDVFDPKTGNNRFETMKNGFYARFWVQQRAFIRRKLFFLKSKLGP